MNLPKLIAVLLFATLSAQPTSATDADAAPDTVLFNGKIFTADASRPYVQALAIRSDRIVATGDFATIRALSGPQTRLIDLGGRTVIPGINDAHQHLSVTPPGGLELQLKSDDPSWPEVRDAIQAAVRNGSARLIVGTIGPTVLQDSHGPVRFGRGQS
jgi:predicted amidohydrolase YtcJ